MHPSPKYFGDTLLPHYCKNGHTMIRGLSKTKKIYNCCFNWFIPCGLLNQDGGEVS